MGIGADMNDFGRTVIVFRMQHSLSNEQTATECFHYGRTLAILPLNEHLSSIVVTIDSGKAEQILKEIKRIKFWVDSFNNLQNQYNALEVLF